MKKVPNKIGHIIEEHNGDNTHTVQRLQAHHQSQQPMLLKPLMSCSIQLYETPSNSTNYMTIDDMQIPISGYQNVATKTKPKIENPTKRSNPPNQKIPPKTHWEIWKERSECALTRLNYD